MRQVVLDTETTGLDFRKGHRLIEIGCVELINRQVTQRRFHVYVNPQFEIDAAAQAVHGISNEMLADKPLFADIVADFIDFVSDAELLIHNAEFDRGFLDNELALLGRPPLADVVSGITDTLRMARELRPGRRNSLDVLCKEFDVDNSGRQLHGALLDAELLAEVYLAMTRGQETLLMELDSAPAGALAAPMLADGLPRPRVLHASAAELAEHQRVLEEIARESQGTCLWQIVEASSAGAAAAGSSPA